MNASGWVVVSPRYDMDGKLTDIKLDRITQHRPQGLSHGERAFRLGIEIPESVFAPFACVDVVVPEGDVIEPTVEIG